MKFVGLKRSMKIAGLKLKKYSPQIMLAAGCVGAVGATVLACKETLKLEETLDECKEDLELIELNYAQDENYDESQYKKDKAIQTLKNAGKVVKLYLPAGALAIASYSLIGKSAVDSYHREASLAAEVASLTTAFKSYRKRVVDTFGEEVDRDLRFGIKQEKIEETVTDEKGKEKKIKKTVNVVDGIEYSDYCRFFDQTCVGWDKNPEYNKMFLNSVQQYCNNLLVSQGFLFLNDVYKQIGMEPSIAGQSVGWIYDPENPVGDNYVDFGIFEVVNAKAVNNLEPVFLLDFNVDGDILSSPLLKMWKK